MEKSVKLDLLNQIMQRNDLNVRMRAKILEDIHLELANNIEDKPPAVKKQYVMLMSNTNREFDKVCDRIGWVLQIPEEDSPHTAAEKLMKAGYEFNQTPKGRRMPVKTIGEICEVVSARLLKEQDIWVKTKEPVLIVATDNYLPTV